MRQQRRDQPARRPSRLPAINLPPEVEECPRRGGGLCHVARRHDHLLHGNDVVGGSGGRILGEPFRREMIRRNPAYELPVHFHIRLDEQVRQGRQRRDAVPKRHACVHGVNEEPGFTDANGHAAVILESRTGVDDQSRMTSHVAEDTCITGVCQRSSVVRTLRSCLRGRVVGELVMSRTSHRVS